MTDGTLHQNNQFGTLPNFGQLKELQNQNFSPVIRGGNSNFSPVIPGAGNVISPDSVLNTENQGGGGFIQSLSNFAFGKKGEGDREGTRGPSGLGTTIDAISGLSQLYFGLKSFGLAKDQFKESKRQFNLNFGAQAQTVNTRLEARQRAQVAANPDAEAVDTFLARNRIQTGTGG